ncbi:rod-binding protein [Myxococcota bacterium]|nr:rod-binding protein [Myxococcota bacterium]
MKAIDSVGVMTELSLGKLPEGKTDEATALRNFEAYFLGEMLRIAAPENPNGLFDGGQAGRMYREHFHQELARIVAESGGVGLAASMAGQLSKPGEAAGDAAAADRGKETDGREEPIR